MNGEVVRRMGKMSETCRKLRWMLQSSRAPSTRVSWTWHRGQSETGWSSWIGLSLSRRHETVAKQTAEEGPQTRSPFRFVR